MSLGPTGGRVLDGCAHAPTLAPLSLCGEPFRSHLSGEWVLSLPQPPAVQSQGQRHRMCSGSDYQALPGPSCPSASLQNQALSTRRDGAWTCRLLHHGGFSECPGAQAQQGTPAQGTAVGSPARPQDSTYTQEARPRPGQCPCCHSHQAVRHPQHLSLSRAAWLLGPPWGLSS